MTLHRRAGWAIMVAGIALPAATLASPGTTTTLSKADLTKEPVALDHWRYRAGDDASWADRGYDDSSWEVVDPKLSGPSFPEDFRGEAWLRNTVVLGSDVEDREFAFFVVHVSALEIYVNGRRSYSMSDLPETEFEQSLRPIHLEPGPNTIAVHLRSRRWEDLRNESFLVGFDAKLGAVSKVVPHAVLARKLSIEIWSMTVGATLVLGLLNLALYFFDPERKRNLLLAVLCGLLAALLGGLFWTERAQTQDQLLTTVYVDKVIMAPIAPLFLFLVRSALDLSSKWVMRVMVPIAVCLAAFFWVIPMVVYFTYLVVGMLEAVRVTGLALFRRKEGAWILAIGVALFLLGVGSEMAFHLVSGAASRINGPGFGLIGFLLAISASLGRDLAQGRAAEIERVKLEAENEHQQQELEAARKLEAAHRELEDKHHELQQTQAQLVQSEKMASLGMLVAGIAHELNTPIGAMNSAQETLARAHDKLREHVANSAPEAVSDRKFTKPVEIIDGAISVLKSGGERVANIVRRLKSFARLDEAELQRFDLHEGIEDTIQIAHHELKGEVEVRKEFGEIPEILCYPSQINQVMLNLLINARQAIDGAGEIEIRTWHDEEHVHVAVKDTGCGMDAEVRKRVFDPGFTTKGVGVGTGLGLSICHQIVAAHQGEIRVESQPGEGSTLTFSLPIDSGPPREEQK